MGTKTTVQKTEIPEQTPEEREAYAMFSAIFDAQMSRDYTKSERRKFVYNKQAEIDEIDRSLAGATDPKYRQQLLNTKYKLQSEGGREKVTFDYIEKPEVRARRERNQAESDKINKLFFSSAEKLLRGDFSISPKQRAQIQSITKEFFDPTMDLLRVEFDRSEEAVTSAVQRLMESGKQDMLFELANQKKQMQTQASELGRSFQDTRFQREMGELTSGAFERLTRAGTADIAGAIAALRGQRTAALGGISEQKGLSGYNLALSAAQPLSQFGAGAQFAQIQNVIRAQEQAALGLPISQLQQSIAQMGNLRAAQPTVSTTQPWGFLDVLGALAGAGATAFTGFKAFGK